MGDAKRIKQVLVNLVSNAVKFTKKGGVKVYASLEEFQMEEGISCSTFTKAVEGIARNNAKEKLLKIDIEDTGMGIKEEDQEKVFELFGTASEKRANPTGTGIGLAICKMITEKLGGSIFLDSSPMRGSKFTVTFQVKVATKKSAPSIVVTKENSSR